MRQFPRYSDEQRKIIQLAAWQTALDAEAAAENWRLDWLLERNLRRLGRWNRRMVMEQSFFRYHCYRAGELEQSRDFIRWAGFYEAKQEREAQYRRLVYEHLRELRRRSGLGALALDPVGA